MSNVSLGQALITPIGEGADKLLIVSGYASHTMASWHMKKISELKLNPIDIELTVGMCPSDGLMADIHNGFKDLSAFRDVQYPSFSCRYVYRRPAVHSKIYIWLKDGHPIHANAGSANYTQNGWFRAGLREYVVECDSAVAYDYYQELENDTIICNHAEIEDNIRLTSRRVARKIEQEDDLVILPGSLPSVKLSLLTSDGDVGYGSGINWGHRRNGTKREPNQAYIPLPVPIARSGFFPLEKQHFSVITDDNRQLILRVEQQNDKAITTPLNNSLIGEYLRNRIGVANGAFVTKQDLENYGRTDVTFRKFDEEQFEMDFSIAAL